MWEYVGRSQQQLPVSQSAQAFSPRDFYVANLQPGPVGPETRNEDSMLYDVYSEEWRRLAMDGAIATGLAFSSDFVQLVPDGPMVDGKITRASSLIFAPVYHDAVFPGSPPPDPARGFPAGPGGRAVVGFASCFFSWDALFADLLPHFITGIDVVMNTSRGNLFTFSVDGGRVRNVGEGALHRPGWMDGFARSFSLAVNPPYAGVPGNWTATVYPTDALLAEYLTDRPRDVAIAAGGLILLVVFLTFCFDQFSTRQLRQLKRDHEIERDRIEAREAKGRLVACKRARRELTPGLRSPPPQLISTLRTNLASAGSEDAVLIAAVRAARAGASRLEPSARL